MSNSLLFEEPPTFVFQLNTFIHLNSCKHYRLRCCYLEFFNKEELFIFSANKVAAVEVP